MKNDFCQLWLTCANKEEADKIQNTLLVKHLVTCVRQIPGTSKYKWQGKIESSKEIFLEMLSSTSHFDEVEREVTKLHSYKTFVLTATPISRVSQKAEQWLKKELKNV